MKGSFALILYRLGLSLSYGMSTRSICCIALAQIFRGSVSTLSGLATSPVVMDRLSPKQRSKVMSKVKGVNTTPELRVRRALHAIGYRFRLHRKDLPGKPDIVLPKHRLCLFVHGCYWHQHQGCKRCTFPKTNTEFWAKKFNQNRIRDERVTAALIQAGWKVCVIWECQTKDQTTLLASIARCLSIDV
jgi:DNA mismatch endonuclease (patch repair protein)